MGGTHFNEDKMKMKTNRSKKNNERAVVVTTSHRGVFFGYANDVNGEIIKLRAARNCVYWSADVKGFIGLAATGPSKNCKVGPAADISLRGITSVIECSPPAVAAWESAPWK
jgi:hypothetical protein